MGVFMLSGTTVTGPPPPTTSSTGSQQHQQQPLLLVTARSGGNVTTTTLSSSVVPSSGVTGTNFNYRNNPLSYSTFIVGKHSTTSSTGRSNSDSDQIYCNQSNLTYNNRNTRNSNSNSNLSNCKQNYKGQGQKISTPPATMTRNCKGKLCMLNFEISNVQLTIRDMT